MKKIKLLMVGLLASTAIFSQTNTFPTTGNVGIGTLSPVTPLHISTNAGFQCGGGRYTIRLGWTCNTPSLATYWDFVVGSGALSFYGNLNGVNKQVFNLNQNGNAILDGKLTCKELKVQANPWADYVFAPTYKLMPLQDVETYIKANKHLPGIPSALTIETDGLEIGAMTVLMMEKIEELTLYSIELNKQLVEMQKQIDELKNK